MQFKGDASSLHDEAWGEEAARIVMLEMALHSDLRHAPLPAGQ